MKRNTLITIILVIAVAAGSFFAGTKYNQSQRRAFEGGDGRFNQFRDRAGGQSLRPVRGEVISVDDTGITVKMQDGSSKIIVLSGTTAINKAAEGTKSDLLTGTTVMVFGKENTDGSITAQNIQVNPQLRGGPGSNQQ